MKQHWREYAIATIFIAVMFAMSAGSIWRNRQQFHIEGTKNPVLILQQASDVVSDNVWKKEEISKISSEVSMLLSGKRYLESSQVLMGKEGWLFYKVENDGKPIEDYRGTNPYTQEEMQQIAENLEMQQAYLEGKGIRMVIELLPNKESVYSEYLPDEIYQVAKEGKEDLLVKYLQEHTDLEVVYPKEELIQHNQDLQLYYKYDTHWTFAGTFIGVQQLLKQINGTYHEISPDYFYEEKRNDVSIRDLARISNMDSYFPEDTYYSICDEAMDPNQYIDEEVLIVGDSFGEYLLYYFEHYFTRHCDWINQSAFTPDMIGSQYKPQIVIVEVADRYLDRLKTVNFVK